MNELGQMIANFPDNPILHLVLSAFVIIYILLFLYFKHKQFHSTDKPPELLYLQKHQKLELIPNIPNIVEVKTGIYLKNFPVFDLINNQFTLDALIWFEFNPSLVQLETVENFSFERGRVVSKSIPEMKLEKNLLLVKYNIQLQFSTNLDHKFFPMNDHVMHIVMTNENISPLELFYTARESSFSWSKKLYTHDWHIVGKAVRTGYADLLLDWFDKSKKISHPRVVYSLLLARSGMRKAVLIFVPVLIVYLLGSYSLILNPKTLAGPILSMGIGSVSGLLAYRFVIEKVAPNVGYFTLTEYFYTLVLAVSFVTFLIGFLHINYPDTNALKNFSIIWFVITQFVVIFALHYYLKTWNKPKKQSAAKEKPRLVINRFVSKQSKKITLKTLSKYSEQLPEFPTPNDRNWLNLDYSSFYKEYRKHYVTYLLNKFLYYFEIKKYPPWSPELFKNCLAELVDERESVYKGNYVVKLSVVDGARTIVWGDLQGSFHSLIRDLNKLHELGFIDDKLKITSPQFFFIFNGDLIDRSPYVLETLTLAMILILNNPEQVFYVKGNHENTNVWRDFQTYQEVVIKTQFLGKKTTELLLDYLERFFDTLPTAVYLVGQEKGVARGVVRISHFRAKDLPYSEDNIKEFILDKQSPPIDYLFLDSYFEKKQKFFIDALIVGLNRSTIYKVTRGLELLPPDKGATTWSLISSPITTYQELYHFHYDTFLVVNIDGLVNEWTLTLYSRDTRKSDGFTPSYFHLVYGIEIKNLQQLSELNYKKEIDLGCTLDLSKTSAILGERIREGLHLGVTQKNLEGGLSSKHLPIRIITLDDEYTPHLAKQNIVSFVDYFHSQLVISPVGTSTTEALLPLIKEEKLLVLFPYTGATILRNPELTHIVHFRPSYAKEAQALINYAIHSLGVRRLALFYQDDAYGWSALEGAREVLKKHKRVECVEASYQRNNPNIDISAKKILEFNPSVILFFSTHSPSVALVHKLGVNNLTDKYLLGISFLTDSFRSFLRTFGLDMTISRVVPQISSSHLVIVDEYLHATKQQKTFNYVPSEDSLEGYINASLFCFIAEFIHSPISITELIKAFEGIKNMNYKGLELNFNSETRELSSAIWLDTGTKEWITLNDFKHH